MCERIGTDWKIGHRGWGIAAGVGHWTLGALAAVPPAGAGTGHAAAPRRSEPVLLPDAP